MTNKRKFKLEVIAGGVLDIVDEEGYVVCEHVGGMDYANLIAAAPDLYNALEQAVRWIEYVGAQDTSTLRATLAKARGETL